MEVFNTFLPTGCKTRDFYFQIIIDPEIVHADIPLATDAMPLAGLVHFFANLYSSRPDTGLEKK